MTAEFSVVCFWVLKDIAPSPPLRVTYIPHLFYLSPEHHAGILRKHLHFHPATASQTAQTTCRRDRKDSKLQQETERPNQTQTVLLFQQALWKLTTVKTSECCYLCVQPKFPKILLLVHKPLVSRACTITWAQPAEDSLAQTLQTVGPDLVLSSSHLSFSLVSSLKHPGFPPWASSSQSTLSFLPLSPMCWTGQRRPPNTLSLHVKRDSTLSCCPFGCTIFHMRAANEYKGRKRSTCFAGAFSHFICRYRHISGVLGGRIRASFLHFNPALPFPKASLEHPPISTGCWSHCEDAWVRLTSGDSTAHLLGLARNWPAL